MKRNLTFIVLAKDPGDSKEIGRALSAHPGSSLLTISDDAEQVFTETRRLRPSAVVINLAHMGEPALKLVQRIVAEKKVQISQGEIVARGEKASYELSRGMIYLTGNPEITSEGRSVEAEAFIINRNKNTFAVLPGKYRIKFPAKTKERASVH